MKVKLIAGSVRQWVGVVPTQIRDVLQDERPDANMPDGHTLIRLDQDFREP